MKKTFIFISIIILGLCTACLGKNNRIEGSGNIVKEQREVGKFSKIDVSRAIQVILTQGEPQSVAVESDDNIVKLIETKVEGQTLTLKITEQRGQHINSIAPTKGMKVYITVASLSGIEASSAASVESTSVWKLDILNLEVSSAASIDLNIEAATINAELSSAAKITLQGKAQKIDIEGSSASKVDAAQLTASKADIEISSAAFVSVNVSDEIRYEVSSGAKLDLTGNANVITSEVSSGGRVSHNK